MNRYTVNSLIGQGSFGRVYKALRKTDSQVVAVKIISKRGRTNKELKNLRRECEIQAKLKHPNIIEMLESFETKNDLVVVTEFALIDLHRYTTRNGTLTEERAQKLVCHLVSALYYLHSNRILHRDLKPQNVLLNEDLHAKLCDFGLARNMTVGTHVLTSIKGTPLYMAPELLAEKPYDHQADLWSLGCISYESMVGQPPFCTTSILHLVKLIKHEEVKWPSFLSSSCRSFLQGLLEKDPTMRISWAQILCHPFVEDKLFISGIKSDNSPFINPPKTQNNQSKVEAKENLNPTKFMKKSTQYDNISIHSTATDNLLSSRDSTNAIPPSEVEQLETDVEETINHYTVPFADSSFNDNVVFVKAGERLNIGNLMAEAAKAPVINSETCFVSGNSNLVLNHMNDNFMPIQWQDNVMIANESKSNTKNQTQTKISSCKKSRNKNLEKRKLNQNLNNFSLRLGHQSHDIEAHRKATDIQQLAFKNDIDKEKDKTPALLKHSTQSTDEKQSSNNSPPCLLPGWDSCDESQSPPIENEEWLAFLHRTMQEVLDGELESLKQHNLVSIIVAPLRNTKAIPKVINSVAQLLALPIVLAEPENVIELIQSVYIDVKLVPNLMYASKLLIYQKSPNDSTASLQPNCNVNRNLRSISELHTEEIITAMRLYELICHLVHLKEKFLSQFCDAVAVLSAYDLLINFFNHDFNNVHAVRIANCCLALFCCVLRELPENADLVERIIFSSKLDLLSLLENQNDLMRMRVCMLFRLLGRFSSRGLQSIWNIDIKMALENLADDENEEVQKEAENTLEELRHFSFYA